MERQVYPGEFYRHFKNKLYQILAVATHRGWWFIRLFMGILVFM